MIWLVWRRYRVLFVIIVAGLVGLCVWMILQGHASDAAETSAACRHGSFRCHTRSGVFSLSDQATAINLVLLAVPCLLGIVFGAPLVAGEIERFTNRLAWTQGVSRTRWLVVKWCLIGLALLVFVVPLTLVAQWWTGQAGSLDLNLWLAGGHGRLQPLYFPVTGLALSAYTVLAFALGCAFGALLRRTTWAIVGTVAAYVAISVLMVLVVRPSLAPQDFDTVHVTVSAQGVAQGFGDPANSEPTGSWDLGFAYRYIPGAAAAPSDESATAAGQQCGRQPTTAMYLSCLSDDHIEMGNYYQPSNHYWELQWRESVILWVLAVGLLGLTIWSIRRWRA